MDACSNPKQPRLINCTVFFIRITDGIAILFWFHCCLQQNNYGGHVLVGESKDEEAY